MKRLLISLAVLSAAISCTFNSAIVGSGVPADKTIELSSFESIVLKGSLDLYIIQTEGVHQAVLHADDNLIDYYTFEVVGNTLEISTKSGVSIVPKEKAVAIISVEQLSKVKVTGSGDIVIPGALSASRDVTLSISGSGDIEANDIACGDFVSKISGSGDISLGTLSSKDAYFEINGSGDVVIETLSANSVGMKISGSGDITAGCEDAGAIDITINGSGDVNLHGSASSLTHKVNGSGKVNARALSLAN